MRSELLFPTGVGTCLLLLYHAPMRWKRYFHTIWLLSFTFLFLLAFTPEWPAFGKEDYQFRTIVGVRQFDFVTWETFAAFTKGEAILSRGQHFLDEETRKQTVLDFLSLIQQSQAINREIDALYVDPDIIDPKQASAALQAELVEIRRQLDLLQPLAESIVQNQVGTILVEEGFGIFGNAWPPVMMHITPLPSILITSSRDFIEQTHGFPLVHGLTTPQKEEMETAVFNNVNQSALVVPIGGLGIYPAMIQETSSINWLVEVVAHEWSHHWMGFYPVSLNYGLDPQVRIINETTASTFDREIAALVINRFYPEFVPPPPEPTVEPEIPPVPEPDVPSDFEFGPEMAITRITADRMLAEGNIAGAETYMEARRRVFVDHGYNIRKLNQAYFAFYGAYAPAPEQGNLGANGGDPISPLIQEIRTNSPTLRTFMENIAPVGSFEKLVEVAAELREKDEG